MEDCGCKRKCFERISKEVRDSVYEDYAGLNNAEKYIYFYGLIYRIHERSKKNKVDQNERYHIRVKGFHEIVCQRAFRIIHKLPLVTLRKLIPKINKSLDSRGIFSFDFKESATDYTLKPVKDHIISLLNEGSEFLECLKRGEKPNFTKMWQHYRDTYESVPGTYLPSNDYLDEENLEEQGKVKIMSLSTYRNICKEICTEKLSTLSCNAENQSDSNLGIDISAIDGIDEAENPMMLQQPARLNNLKSCKRRSLKKKKEEIIKPSTSKVRPLLLVPNLFNSNILVENVRHNMAFQNIEISPSEWLVCVKK